jgi:hypothetical protein
MSLIFPTLSCFIKNIKSDGVSHSQTQSQSLVFTWPQVQSQLHRQNIPQNTNPQATDFCHHTQTSSQESPATDTSSTPQTIHNSSDQNLTTLPNPRPSSPLQIILPIRPQSASSSHTPPHLQAIPSSNTHTMITRSKAGITKPKIFNVESQMSSIIEEPLFVSEALSNKQWKAAMDVEFNALQDNGTWSLVPQDRATNIVSNKWIFKVKQNSDGSINKL